MPHNKLRRAIAELLGYSVEQDMDGTWRLYHGDRAIAAEMTEADIWLRCPNWPEDIGAAMALLNDPRITAVAIDKNCSGIGWCVSVNNTTDRPCRDFDYLALTICLAWHEAVSGRKWKEPADAE